MKYSTRFGENSWNFLSKQLAEVRLCRMLKMASPSRSQGCQRATVSTAPPSGARKRTSRRGVPQARQVQRGNRPWRQRTPSVRRLHVRQWPGTVSNSQPHVQHTHLVAALAAFCTRAPLGAAMADPAVGVLPVGDAPIHETALAAADAFPDHDGLFEVGDAAPDGLLAAWFAVGLLRSEVWFVHLFEFLSSQFSKPKIQNWKPKT